MPKEPPPGVLGGLPHTRPHRRSNKRPAPPGVAGAATAKTSAGPRNTAKRPVSKAPGARAGSTTARTPPPRPLRAATDARTAPPVRAPAPAHDNSAGPLTTAVQAAAELAEIGLSASARALRGALARLPRR